METLPCELSGKVFSYLESRNVHQYRGVCNEWKLIISDLARPRVELARNFTRTFKVFPKATLIARKFHNLEHIPCDYPGDVHLKLDCYAIKYVLHKHPRLTDLFIVYNSYDSRYSLDAIYRFDLNTLHFIMDAATRGLPDITKCNARTVVMTLPVYYQQHISDYRSDHRSILDEFSKSNVQTLVLNNNVSTQNMCTYIAHTTFKQDQTCICNVDDITITNRLLFNKQHVKYPDTVLVANKYNNVHLRNMHTGNITDGTLVAFVPSDIPGEVGIVPLDITKVFIGIATERIEPFQDGCVTLIGPVNDIGNSSVIPATTYYLSNGILRSTEYDKPVGGVLCVGYSFTEVVFIV
jgi:hypothetical protein